jgi:hypothetical protein
MSVILAGACGIIDAIERNGVKYAQGWSKIFWHAVRKTRGVFCSGRVGRLIQINNWMYNDGVSNEIDQ